MLGPLHPSLKKPDRGFSCQLPPQATRISEEVCLGQANDIGRLYSRDVPHAQQLRCRPAKSKVLRRNTQAKKRRYRATAVHGFYRHTSASSFQWFMARCNSCSGIITKNDVVCYVCGQPVSETRPAWRSLFRIWAKPQSPSEYMRAKNAILQQSQDAQALN